ncbi:FAD-binding oxidoreductase [Clostridium coskatii]|uniref:FAD-linked oxidoreductase YvdP n=1 Tax=Clostridium coskatii TaxID=1705578 RepID=A0A166UBR4_9CLOT|nr:FAD-binding oxidoreductase [Clostridium coskatii]OAA94777.1 putative FAD-linked oxidoreductase YvdP [Clostridium coskatii]OBR91410.1 putative FAD-linked oxidoreductase YvdP [Clostridium coskatii]
MKYSKEPELTGRIVLPENPQYNAARQDFNTFFDKFPLVIVFAQETQDVINAVKWARYNHVPIRMRSGGHNYEALSVINAGIVIDVSEMNRVKEIDRKCNTVTVQTGIRNIALYNALWSERMVVPSGVCATPGIAGVTLGGGHSILSRQWGLTLDNLLELEMVDADGQVICANANHHSDLFWASRGGGGGNFGICTTFRFRTHHIDTVGFAEIIWSLNDLESVLPIWERYTLPGTDKRLTPTLTIFSGEQSLILMQGVFLGSVKELRHLLQPLLRAGSPQNVTIEEMSWIDAATRIADSQPQSPLPFKSVGPYVYNLLPNKGIETIRHFVNEPPTSSVSVFFHGLGGEVAKVSSTATAYFQRGALSNMSIFSTWDKSEDASLGIRWVEDFRKAMLPFTRYVYVNTQDLSIRDWPHVYYGGNFHRLTKVKAKYDPQNVFRFPQSIPPSSEC